MSKRAKKAISVFKSYATQIDGIKNIQQANNWKMKVIDSLVIYLGKDAALTNRFAGTYFTEPVKRPVGENYIKDIIYKTEHIFKEDRKKLFDDLLNDIIHHIEQNGVLANYLNTNFLSQFTTVQIWGGILVAGNIVFWSGWFVGGTQKERETITKETQLQDTIEKCVQYRNFLRMQEEITGDLQNAVQEREVKIQFLQIRVDSLINISNQMTRFR
jgi:hypothetical protein